MRKFGVYLVKVPEGGDTKNGEDKKLQEKLAKISQNWQEILTFKS